jgi:hypothetical protein
MKELQNIDGVTVRDLIGLKNSPAAIRMKKTGESRFATPCKKVRRCKS